MAPRSLPRFTHSLLVFALALGLLTAGVSACASYSDQLARAEQHYYNARYEAALVNLDDLEIHRARLSGAERVRYDLTRGMSHLRLEQRDDARHWLALAREESREAPGVLGNEARQTIERALAELDPLREGASGAGVQGDAGGVDASAGR